MRLLHRLSFLLVLALSAGCIPDEIVPATQVIVAVNSDLELGRALTTIKVMVQTPDGGATVAEPAPFALAIGGETTTGKVALPLSFGIAKPKGGTDTFRLVVAGYGPLGPGGSEIQVIEQRVLASFQNDRTLRATVFLGSACFQKLCNQPPDQSQTCYVASLGPISAGECGPIQMAVLEVVRPKHELVNVDWPEKPDTGAAPEAAPSAADRETVGPAGGTVRNKRVRVTVPPGALAAEVPISIEPSALVSDTVFEAWDVTPSGAVVRQPVNITYYYDEAELAGQSAADFSIATYVGGRWQPLEGAQHDLVARTFSGTTARLSSVAVTRRAAEPNDCPPRACANGICVDGPGTYTCSCNPGFNYDPATRACNDVNDCQPGLCANGTCVDGVNDYTCRCNPGNMGTGTKSCTGVDNCPSGACANGTCIDGENDYRCSCNDGFTYEPSTHRCVNPNNCPPAGACTNGTCVDGLGDYSCSCNYGFIYEPSTHRCVNPDNCPRTGACTNGTCVDGLGDYSCRCSTGYQPSGPHGCVPVPLNECATRDICGEGGTCMDTPGGYTCRCGPNAVPTGPNGRCSCQLPWGDCDRDPSNGCEDRMDLVTFCGGCRSCITGVSFKRASLDPDRPLTITPCTARDNSGTVCGVNRTCSTASGAATCSPLPAVPLTCSPACVPPSSCVSGKCSAGPIVPAACTPACAAPYACVRGSCVRGVL